MKLNRLQKTLERGRNRTMGLLTAALAMMLSAAGSATAGNPVDELNHRYGCSAGGKKINISYQSRGDPWTVGVNLDGNNYPLIVINERASYEQPFEIVAFEYFTACEQAIALAADNNRLHLMRNPIRARRMLFRADCSAIGRMTREGLMRGSRSATTLLNAFNYQRAKQSYLGVLFSDRADNIRKTCPP